MADNKDNKGSSGNSSSSSNDLPAKDIKSMQAELYDLDKNPIKYATSEPGKYTFDAHDKPYMELTLRHGKHSERVQQILRQKIEARALDFPRWPGDHTSGTRFMWLESRFQYDRERLSPDFDQDWREYRAKYLHSLNLHPTEPIHVPEYETLTINPLRRFLQKPGNLFEKNFIYPFATNRYTSSVTRWVISRYFASMLGFMFLYYNIRYNGRDWTKMGGIEVAKSKPKTFPGDGPHFPFKEYKTEGAHHFLHGFPQRTIFKDLRDYEDTSIVL